MSNSYDKHYQTENLFGDPYPELIQFMAENPDKGTLLDVGCGQGRDAIELARLGYTVTGIDRSKVGIEQMNQISKAEKLNLHGLVADIYAFNRFHEFDIILLDSIFHFTEKDQEKELGLLRKIGSQINSGSMIIVCIQDTGNKVLILNQAIDKARKLKRLKDLAFSYTFCDDETGHKSVTNYRLVIVVK
jgi:2-polyprenyl-3-methyl-5-hydroxy-6-metoxy-1,4-benzoquinol methylase